MNDLFLDELSFIWLVPRLLRRFAARVERCSS
jgi:hypothetical protein